MALENNDSRRKTAGKHATGKVYLSAEALKTIIMYSKRYANDSIPEYEWKEVYGFLIGRIEGQDVHVDSAVAMTSGEATEVTFDAEHYSRAWALDNEISERNDNSFVCGWWHSHPFKNNPNSLFLSSIDVYNHIGFQDPNPLSIALVHDPSKVKSREVPYGIKIFRLTRTDFSAEDLDRFALDLKPEGNTRSDENEYIYYEIPFEVTGVTPQRIFEWLVDVFEKTRKGTPVEMAYKEDQTSNAGAGLSAGEQAGTSFLGENNGGIGQLGTADGDERLTPPKVKSSFQGGFDLMGTKQQDDLLTGDETSTSGPLPTIPVLTLSLPMEMENVNKVNTIPLNGFKENDLESQDDIADEYFFDGIDLKKLGKHGIALKSFRRAWLAYSNKEAIFKKTFIKNELMECYYWLGEYEDCIVESDNVLRLGENIGNFYFMGNAQEYKGRSFLKLKEFQHAMASFLEARKLFELGNQYAKSGQCMEFIARIEANDKAPDLARVALFLTRALKFYRQAKEQPNPFDPDWTRTDLLINHGRILAKKIQELLSYIKIPELYNKISNDLRDLAIFLD
ncbi:MAG: hypothetical protein ACTSWN_03960 [Promethearchaeota archaeon]